MSDTATAPAPASPEVAAEAPEAPAVEPAAPGQRSTGGTPRRPEDGPAPPMTRESAQNILRQAYGRQRELQEGQEAPASEAGAEPAPTPPETGQPASGPRAAPPGARERGTDGRFRPRDKVDATPDAAVQQGQTSAPPRRDAPARAPATQGAPGRQPATPGVEATDAPPSSATPDTGPPPPDAAPTQGEATTRVPLDGEDFKSARWLRAFQAEPGLRRTVGRIQADPNLSAANKAAKLAEQLADGERAADAAEWRAQQMRDLRRQDPQAYIRQVEADEAETEAGNQLALRITQMIAEAYEVDPDDPDFLEAGPREGDDRIEGLRRFVAYTSKKSPVFKTTVAEALEAQAKAHQAQIEALKAQHKLDVEAATERGRSQGRSPYGRGGAPPRTNGSGVVPVGQDEGPGGGPRVPAKAPTVAGIRDLIGLGYQQREPSS